jgi:hypothetical protein
MDDVTVPPGAVVITQREVYDKIVAIEQAVTGLPARVQKLETDVDSLRSKVWLLTGASGVMGTIVGALINRLLAG